MSSPFKAIRNWFSRSKMDEEEVSVISDTDSGAKASESENKNYSSKNNGKESDVEAASESETENDVDKNDKKESDIETVVYERRNSTTPTEEKKTRLRRRQPKPSNIPYLEDDNSSDDKISESDSGTKVVQPLNLRKRRPVCKLNSDSEASPSKKPRSDQSSMSKTLRSESSSTEEEIDITESQTIVKNKKNNPINKQNVPLIETEIPSQESEFFSAKDDSLEKPNGNLNVDNEITTDENTAEDQSVDVEKLRDNLNVEVEVKAATKDKPTGVEKLSGDLNVKINNTKENETVYVESSSYNINVEDENKIEMNTKNVKQGKPVKRKRHITICRLIDTVLSKKHPLHKYCHLFTHSSLKQLSNKELESLRLAAYALGPKYK